MLDIITVIIREFFGICSFICICCCYREYFGRKIEGSIICRKSISTLAIEISPHLSDIGMLIMSGAMILFIGIGISVIPVLRTNPKDTLSDMEG